MEFFSKWDGQLLEACKKGSGCVPVRVHTCACVPTPLLGMQKSGSGCSEWGILLWTKAEGMIEINGQLINYKT